MFFPIDSMQLINYNKNVLIYGLGMKFIREFDS